MVNHRMHFKPVAKQIMALMSICLIVLSMFLFVSTIQVAKGVAAVNTITVGKTVGVDYEYSSIQEAIDTANSGDTVLVDAGTYSENVKVDKTITLTGKNIASVIIDGGDAGTALTVTADYVTVSGFTITNGGGASSGFPTVKVYDGSTTGLGDGVYLKGSNTQLSGCFITANQKSGVEVTSSNNIITGNQITDEQTGIIISSGSNTVSGNHISGCVNSIQVNGDDNTIASNSLINGDTGIASSGTSNLISSNTITGFNTAMSVSGSDNRILSNIVNQNCDGISLGPLSNSVVSDNTIAHCTSGDYSFGLAMVGCSQVTVSNNHIIGNRYDVTLEYCNYNIIRNNDIVDSQIDGLSLTNSANNQILQNNFDDNGIYVTSSNTEMHYDSIRLYNAGYNTISGNSITRSGYGAIVLISTSPYVYGHDSSSYNTISSNLIMDNKVGVEVSWYSAYNTIASNTISYNNGNGAFGVYICEGASHNDVSANYISHNYYGVYLYDNVILNSVRDNSICDNINTGVVISSPPTSNIKPNHQCSGNIISGNNIAGNKESGVSISGWGETSSGVSVSDNNQIDRNNIINNYQYGVTITKSSFNRIYSNNIINNGANDVGHNGYTENAINYWDNGYPSGGNYWSDCTTDPTNDIYTGPVNSYGYQDQTGGPDGIVDHFYHIEVAATGARDNYPLMSPTESIASTVTSSIPLGSNQQLGLTGVSVNVHSSGSGSVEVTAIEYGTTQPPGTGNVFTGGTYYDVKVTPSSGTTLDGDTLVTITITDDEVNSETVLSYWDDTAGSWEPALNQQYTSPHTISGDIPASALTGTIVEINQPQDTTLNVNCNPQTVNNQAGDETVLSGGLTLTSDGSGVQNEQITLSYSTDGITWTPIGKTLPTASDGTYSYTWSVPSTLANGEYQIKAEFAGDSNFKASSATTRSGGSLFVVPEYGLGALMALGAFFVAYIVFKRMQTGSLRLKSFKP